MIRKSLNQKYKFRASSVSKVIRSPFENGGGEEGDGQVYLK